MIRNKGFSLIELILVLIVLSIGLTTLIFVLRYSIISNTKTHFDTVANWLCQENLELALSIRKNSGFSGVEGYLGTNVEDPVAGFPAYKRITTVSYTDLGGALRSSNDYILIEVEVSAAGFETPLLMEAVVSRHD